MIWVSALVAQRHVKNAYMQWNQKGQNPLSIQSFIQIEELLSVQNDNTVHTEGTW